DLNLPSYSLGNRQNWRDIYHSIAIRVFEQELNIPGLVAEEPSVNMPLNHSNTRVNAIVKALTDRGALYSNPGIAFNLPSIVNTVDSQEMFRRITAQDPTAWALAGAYFLAQSLS